MFRFYQSPDACKKKEKTEEIKSTIYSGKAAYKTTFIGLITSTISLVSLHSDAQAALAESFSLALDLMQECINEATRSDCCLFGETCNISPLHVYHDFNMFAMPHQLLIQEFEVAAFL